VLLLREKRQGQLQLSYFLIATSTTMEDQALKFIQILKGLITVLRRTQRIDRLSLLMINQIASLATVFVSKH